MAPYSKHFVVTRARMAVQYLIVILYISKAKYKKAIVNIFHVACPFCVKDNNRI